MSHTNIAATNEGEKAGYYDSGPQIHLNHFWYISSFSGSPSPFLGDNYQLIFTINPATPIANLTTPPTTQSFAKMPSLLGFSALPHLFIRGYFPLYRFRTWEISYFIRKYALHPVHHSLIFPLLTRPGISQGGRHGLRAAIL